jgi:hypothetical protein
VVLQTKSRAASHKNLPHKKSVPVYKSIYRKQDFLIKGEVWAYIDKKIIQKGLSELGMQKLISDTKKGFPSATLDQIGLCQNCLYHKEKKYKKETIAPQLLLISGLFYV